MTASVSANLLGDLDRCLVGHSDGDVVTALLRHVLTLLPGHLLCVVFRHLVTGLVRDLVAVLLGDLDWNLVAHLLVVALRVTCLVVYGPALLLVGALLLVFRPVGLGALGLVGLLALRLVLGFLDRTVHRLTMPLIVGLALLLVLGVVGRLVLSLVDSVTLGHRLVARLRLMI